MIFLIFMFLATLSVAGIAGYFSVYGLAKVFAGSFLSVVLMGVALEAGKLMATSFLYRYWKETSWFLKLPMIVLIAALMLLTSIGVSGYLTSSYQIDTLSYKESEEKINLYQDELQRLTERKDEIDAQISALPADYVTAKQRLMTSFKDEYDRLKPRIEFLTLEIQKLKTENIQVQSKIGPIIFISENLGLDPDKSVVWLTIFIVLIFDPLALCLTIATNIVVVNRIKNKEPNKTSPILLQEKDTIEPTVTVPQEPVTSDANFDAVDAIKEINQKLNQV